MATSTDCQAHCPDHVPAELYWDDDIGEFAGRSSDPFVGITQLHDGPELIYARSARRGRPGWVPTRYDVINELYMDPVRFSSVDNIGVGSMLGVDWSLIPLESDPPQHRIYRQLLQPHFNPSAINHYDATIRSVARELIGAFEAQDGCEFVSAFAAPFPSYFFLEQLGMPREMLSQFFAWTNAFTRSTDTAVRTAGARAVVDYLGEYLRARRADLRDDLVTKILTATYDGRPMSESELIGMFYTLFAAGLDTVVSSLGWHLRHLALNPDLQERLRNRPEDIPGAVEDLLRCYGVVATMRTVAADTEFRGVRMKKGDYVLMPGFLASRDPAHYPDPHRVDPDRKQRHLTLATGIHNCLGSHLARREIRIVLEELLPRFRNIRIAPGGVQRWDTTGVWAMTRLDLAWDRIN